MPSAIRQNFKDEPASRRSITGSLPRKDSAAALGCERLASAMSPPFGAGRAVIGLRSLRPGRAPPGCTVHTLALAAPIHNFPSAGA